MAVDLQALSQDVGTGPACAFAQERYDRIALFRTAYSVLVFALTAAATVMLALAVIFAADGEAAKAIATGVGTVLSGTGAGFVLARNQEAKADEQQALADVQTYCGPGGDVDPPKTLLGL